MPLHGPASVLDSREIDKDTTSHVFRDRLTRHRSPARASSRYSYTSDEGGEEDVITPRIPQPYKTSFSAIAPPQRVKRDRSRSTSPCTSSLKGSNRSRSKSPGGRRAHKHVTYNENVVIRDSNTSDSIVTHLSDRDISDSYRNKSENSINMSNSSQHDYSSELRELSQQIVREYSGLNNEENRSSDLPSHDERRVNGKGNTPNGNIKAGPDFGSRNPRQDVQIIKDGNKGKRIIVNEDYDHDRSVSYRVAIKNNYSDEIKQQADEVTNVNCVPLSESEKPVVIERESRHRRSSEPTENGDHEPSRLTPAKRSISASIGNFFRRLSPHVGRKNKKGNLSNASSQSLSPGDEHDGAFQRHNSTSSLSRGKLRRSLMKLMGKSSKKDKSWKKSDSSIEDLNQSNNSRDSRDLAQKASKPSLYMKSIEQSTKTDKDIYQKFKEKQTTPKSGENKPVKPMKVTPRLTSPDFPSTTETSISSSVSAEALNAERVLPPDSLDVRLVPKSIRSLQASQISQISGDDSIGECSIDQNLTGSEPSLLSETSASKQVEVSHTSQENVTLSQTQPLSSENVTQEDTLQRSGSDSFRNERRRVKELKLSYPQMPIIVDSAEYYPKDTPPRTPSYLRISCAVSGYGHYSKYSAYKGIEKRSPYSSTLSLRSSRSDLTTPLSPVEMPIGKIPNIQPPTNYPPFKSEILSPKTPTANNETSFESVVNGACPVINSHVNGDAGCDIAVNGENGHVTHVGNYVSTGDVNKDADYFLGVAQVEEDRLSLLCSKCEMELLNETISEEASGKVRAAAGKANLLISQKFRQFQDLCHQHKHPDPDGKETKCEDLRGFWEMVKLQVDDVDEMFTEIDMMRQNGWNEIKIPSRRSSSSSRSSPKSSSLNVSNASTPSHTPGSRRRAQRVKDTPESSPERSQKAKLAAKIRDDARKKMLAEKRAAMKQQRQQGPESVEIYVADKSDSPVRTSGSDGDEA